jgi:VanZ family protein
MMPAASAGRLPLATTARTVAAVGASLLTLAILLGGRVPEAVHVMSRFPDKLLHALTYGMLAGCWCVALGGRRRALAIAMAVATGLLDEWLQRSIPGRHSDVADLVADGVGATISAWLALPVVGRLLSRTTRRP